MPPGDSLTATLPSGRMGSFSFAGGAGLCLRAVWTVKEISRPHDIELTNVFRFFAIIVAVLKPLKGENGMKAKTAMAAARAILGELCPVGLAGGASMTLADGVVELSVAGDGAKGAMRGYHA